MQEGVPETPDDPIAALTRPLPQDAQTDFNPIKEAIKASIEMAAQEAAAREGGDEPVVPAVIQNPDEGHSSQAVPHFKLMETERQAMMRWLIFQDTESNRPWHHD